MFLASDADFIVIKNGHFYCKGKVDKEYGYDIEKLKKEQLKRGGKR